MSVKKKSPSRDTIVPRFIRLAVHKLRARHKDWSPEKDREHFEAVFASQNYYPFDFYYPGYITIRRFADLASPYLKNLKSVLDLGCGPGEITCELARRHPDVRFVGVDHSPAGIKRALQNAASLHLQNISFLVSDMEKFSPDSPYDIITLFDAFHHMVNPNLFIQRMQEFSSRFVLIEPSGDWKGSWRKDLDFDWLVLELEKIRARLAYSMGEAESPPPSPRADSPRLDQAGVAVEVRYTLADFQRMFSGFGLTVRGTVSGLDIYPPGSRIRSESRKRFNELAYGLYTEIDELLCERGLDLLAKHWVIYAEKGIRKKIIGLPAKLPEPPWPPSPQGAYDVEYIDYEGPRELRAGTEARAKIKLGNRSFRAWSSLDPDKPDYLSYHWLDRRGAAVIWDGERTALPRDIGPGEECNLMFRLKAPASPGRYVLALDMVQEGAAWFSDAGTPWLRIPFRIRKQKAS